MKQNNLLALHQRCVTVIEMMEECFKRIDVCNESIEKFNSTPFMFQPPYEYYLYYIDQVAKNKLIYERLSKWYVEINARLALAQQAKPQNVVQLAEQVYNKAV